MDYITHRRFKANAMCGRINLRYGTRVMSEGGLICKPDGGPICFATSENAKLYFARNDDGMGLERGALTYAIAYGRRRGMAGQRFSDAERETLMRDYPHWLRQDTDYLLFNNDFFAAPVEELRELANRLKIKV